MDFDMQDRKKLRQGSRNRTLLSFVLVARDDNYTDNFSGRLSFCVRYLDHVLRDQKNKVEICVVEWGTSTLLKKCNFTGLDNISLKWVRVNDKEAKRACENILHIPLACNVGIRHASGRFISIGPSDNIMSRSSTLRLLEICEDPQKYGLSGEEVFMAPRRFLAKRWFDTDKSHEEIDQYFNLISSTNFPFYAQRINSMAATGSIIMHRDEWNKCRGVSQLRSGHGGDDIQLLSRITERNTHIDLSNWGVWHFKLPRTSGTRNQTADIKDWNEKYFSVAVEENPKNWGILGEVEAVNVTNKKTEKCDVLATTHDDYAELIVASIRNWKETSLYNRPGKLVMHFYNALKYRTIHIDKFGDLFNLLDIILKQSKASFLITGINFFEKCSRIIFARNKDLFSLVYFDAEQSLDGRLYEEKFVNTITELTSLSHFGHITTYRRHSDKNLKRIAARFEKFRHGVAVFDEAFVFENNLVPFFDHFDNLTVVISHKKNFVLNKIIEEKFSCVCVYSSWWIFVKI